MTDIPEAAINNQSDGIAMEPTSTVTGILARRPHISPLIRRVSVRVGGEKHKEVERFLKFAFVGVVGTLVDLIISNFLMKFVFHVSKDNASLPVWIATTISFIIAVCCNFTLNRYWTYPDSRSRPIVTQLGQFFVVNIVGLLIRSGVILLLAVPFANLIAGLPAGFLHSLSINADTEAFLGSDMALIASISVVMIWNFFVNRYWTYNDIE